MSIRTAATKGQLPTCMVGRIIGKGGAIIRELEAISGCHVHAGKHGGTPTPEDAQPSATDITIRCTAGGTPAQRREAEECCWQVVLLVCHEGLNLNDAYAQVFAGREEQAQLETQRSEEEQMELAVRRMLMNWPEFEVDDVRTALQTADMDEDSAFEFLHSLRATRAENRFEQPVKPQESCRKVARPEREPFPSLSSAPSSVSNSKTWGPGRRSRCPNVENYDVFPNLLAARPRCSIPDRRRAVKLARMA